MEELMWLHDRTISLFSMAFLPKPPHNPIPFNFPGPSPTIYRGSPASGLCPGSLLLLVFPGCDLLFVLMGVIDGCEPHSFGPCSRCFTVSPPTDHGKSRSSIFHISSFTRRIEMDICFNYPSSVSTTTEEHFHNRGQWWRRGRIRWGILEIGAKVRQAPLSSQWLSATKLISKTI